MDTSTRLRIWLQSAGQGIKIASDTHTLIDLVPNVVLRIFQVARECLRIAPPARAHNCGSVEAAGE